MVSQATTQKITPRRINRFGWQPDLPDLRDKLFSETHSENFVRSKQVVSLRDRMPPVFDQGPLGSCTANALIGALAFIRPGFIGSRLALYYYERVIQRTVKYDSGAQLRDGIKVLNKLGVAAERSWPYDIGKFADQPPGAEVLEGADNRVSSYSRIKTLTDMKNCLMSGYPFVFGFTVFESFMTEDVANTGIVPMPQKSEKVEGGHAVIGTGYDANFKGTGQLYIEARNSWSDRWGDQGNLWIPATYIGDPNLADDFWTVRA